jgi:exopolysaccharide production protein ExoQ
MSATSQAIPMKNDAVLQDESVAHLAITWLLIPPLIFLASKGQFWFQHASTNNALTAQFSQYTAKGYTAADFGIEILIYSIIALLLFSRMAQVIDTWRSGPALLALPALAIVSCIWSQFPLRTLKFSVYLTLDTLFAFYLCRRFTPEQRLRLLLLVGWISLILCVGMALFFPFYGVEPSGSGAWRGIYAFKNACTEITVFLLPAALYVPARGLHTRSARVLYLGLTLLVVANTKSATGVVLLVTIFAYIFATRLLRRIHMTDRVASMILGLAIALPIVIATYSYSKVILELLGKDPTLTGRTEIWKAILPSIMKRPILGYGYQAFWKVTTGEVTNVTALKGGVASGAHNGFLNVWLSLGLVGMSLVVYVFARSFRHLFRGMMSEQSRYLQWAGCIVLLMVVVNFDEQDLMVSSDLMWVMFIMACVGLAEGTKRGRLVAGT